MIWLAYLVVLGYIGILLWLISGFKKLAIFPYPPGNEVQKQRAPHTFFSVVVVYRNEAEQLPTLLSSFQQMKYPSSHFELIFVDDDSSDGSSEVIKQTLNHSPHITYTIIPNGKKVLSPKKEGITRAVSQAAHEWIVTTDADCEVPVRWLQTLNDFITTEDPVCVAGPVIFSTNRSLLQDYQHYDGLSLQLVAQGGFGQDRPLVCNGANFSYQKEAFNKVDGFEGNKHLSSGDDVFLLEKMNAQYPGKVRFLKSVDALVSTSPVLSWDALVEQRMRWASKSSHQQNQLMKVIGAIVILANALIVLLFFAALGTVASWSHFFLLLGSKLTIDFIALWHVRKFYPAHFNGYSYFLSAIIYPWLTVLIIAKSITRQARWKGRLTHHKKNTSKEI